MMDFHTPPAYFQCFYETARTYSLPISLLPAIAKVEGGKTGVSNKNINQTFDHGVMQINDVWVKQLSRFGVTEEILRSDVCASIRVAGYILRYEINLAGGNFWLGVGRYHSRTPELHSRYIAKVFAHAAHLQPVYNQWIQYYGK